MANPARRRSDTAQVLVLDDPAVRSNQHADEQPIAREESIRQRAYELYEQRGGEHGHDWDDWLQAEQELTSERTPE